jgi:hypothetical protein
MPGIAQPVTVLSVIRIFRRTPAVGDLTIAADRFDRDRHTMAGGNGIAGDPKITPAGGLQPRILRQNKDGGHRAAFYPVACDLAVAGLDENAARRTDSNTIPRELREASRSELQPVMEINCK